MVEFTPLERAVMDLLLAGEHPVLEALREQFRSATLDSRKYTGVGFFTEFHVPTDLVLCADESDFNLGGVHGEMEDLANGASFVLFIRAGLIKTLEGFTYTDAWPDEVRSLKLSYDQTSRDLDLPRIKK